MPGQDMTEKHLEAFDDVFADIVNALLFEGQKRVSPGDLRDTHARSLYKTDGKLHEQERDVSKLWVSKGIVISLIGFENQTKIDKNMPLRVMGYEGADYRGQLSRKGGALHPVVTLVLYFGMRRWIRPRSLFETISVPEELKAFANDYRVNVFEISFLTDEQLGRFDSDFRIVADYFVQMRRNRDYVPSRRIVGHVDAVLKLLSALTRDNRFEEAQNYFRKGENVTMLSVLDKVEARGIQLGEARGIQLGEARGIQLGEARGEARGILLGRIEMARALLRMGVDAARIAEAARLSIEDIEALRDKTS